MCSPFFFIEKIYRIVDGIFLIDPDGELSNSESKDMKELTRFAVQDIANEIIIQKNWGIPNIEKDLEK